MNRRRTSVAVLVSLFVAVVATCAQQAQNSRRNVGVQLEILDLTNGLPGAWGSSIVGVGGSFGLDKTTEKDKWGKLLYLRTIEGQSRWLPDNSIEVVLQINENGTKRSETIRLEDFEPRTFVLREDRGHGWREVMRLIPIPQLGQQTRLTDAAVEN